MIVTMNKAQKREWAEREAKVALETIKTFSRNFCLNPVGVDSVPEAKVIAAGLSSLLDHDTEKSIDIAACLVEDVNYHALAKRIRTGQDY